MSFKAGAVVIGLEAQTKKFEKQIEAVQKQINRIGQVASQAQKSMGNLANQGFEKLGKATGQFAIRGGKNILGFFGGLINKAKEATFAIGTGLAGAFIALSGYGLKMGNSIQQTAIAFDTMLGDADARRRLMADITKFASTTPFERFELIDASKTLLAMGVSADKIIPSMKMLGDISAGVSTSVQETAFVYGQVRAQGQAYTQDLNQFATRGIPIYEEIAKVLGVTVSQLREGMASKEIAVGFDTVEKAFQNLTKEGGKFNNLMDRQSRSLGGILSNLKDGFDNMVLSFMGITAEGDIRSGSFFDVATQKAAGFQNWLANNEATISEWGGRVFGAIAQGIDSAWSNHIAPALRSFRDWFNSGGKEAIKTFLTEAWAELQRAFNYFATEVYPKVREGLKDFFEWMKSEEGKQALRDVASLIGDIASAVNSIADAWIRAKQEQDKIINEAGGDKKAMLNPINQMKAGWAGWSKLLNRNSGGQVMGNRMYEVGEHNQPELLYMNKRTYLIPGNDGKVFNRNQMDQLAKMQGNTTNSSKSIVINQYGSNLDSVFTSAPLLAV